MHKVIVKKILANHALAPLLRVVLKPVAFLLPDSVVRLIPMKPIVTAKIPSGHEMRYCGGEDILGKAIYWRGYRYVDPETVDLLFQLSGETKVMLDIGASSGLFSILAALSNPSMTVHAFEPEPRVFANLEKNIRINGLLTVTAHKKALSCREGKTTLYVPSNTFPTDASLQKGFRQVCEEIIVDAITVDGFAEKESLTSVDLIKIDTESTEPHVLLGGRRVLERLRPLIICEVLKGLTEDGLHSVLDLYDYRYYWITGSGLVPRKRIEGDPSYRDRNYLFVPEEKFVRVKGLVFEGLV